MAKKKKIINKKPIENKPLEKKENQVDKKENKTPFLEKQFLGISYQLWLIAIILIGIAIVFVYAQYKGPQELNPEDITGGAGKLQIIIVTDELDCENCYINSPLIKILEKNKIQYKVLLLEKDSTERKALIQEYDIKHFPTYLIDVSSITDNMLIEKANGEKSNLLNILKYYENNFKKLASYREIPIYNLKFYETENVYVVEDIFEWDYEQHISHIVNANTTDTKMKLFYDPFSPYFLINYSEIKSKLSQIDMDFYFLGQETSEFSNAYYSGNADYAGWLNVPNYFVCMSRQGLFWEFADEYVKVYCDINSIEDSANCSQSPYFGKPLLEPQLTPIKEKLVKEGKLNQTKFAICFGEGAKEIKADSKMASNLYISEVPALVKGNTYQGFLANIETFICGFEEFYSLKMCSE